MKVRNILEDAVFQTIEDVLNEDRSLSVPRYSAKEQCKNDAACFVLNRMQPRYVSSARGQTYADTEHALNPQLEIDIMTLVHEGLRRVTTVQRSYYRDPNGGFSPNSGTYYHFPVIKGRVLNGMTFQSIGNIEIRLCIEGAKAEMIDPNWQNPYPVAEQTNGAFAFWPCPIPAHADAQRKQFSCELQISDERFERVQHCFLLDIDPRATLQDDLTGGGDYRLADIHVLPIE